MKNTFNGVFRGMNVLVTGHTGFKGSWLSIWLNELGANVIGYALEPPTNPNNFSLSKVKERITDVRGDVRDFKMLNETIKKYKPSVIFHLAAQPLVLKSFELPKETFDVNFGGTVNVLESVRQNPLVRALVCITSDKCYEDRGWSHGYRENDRLGGHDPYSASKGAAELAISSYRSSFFSSGTAVASARAGNVIGGGDFAEYRLVPDCMKALMKNEPIKVRNPKSIRPWQTLFEPLSGYLTLASKLLNSKNEFSEGWNFGPPERKGITAEQIVKKVIVLWGSGTHQIIGNQNDKVKETEMLRLNWDKAAAHLDWMPVYNWEESMNQTVRWFKVYEKSLRDEEIDMYPTCVSHLNDYTKKAKELGVVWAIS